MKKNILGLDLGTTSIGWAYVTEGESPEESMINQLGVRVVPLSTDEETDFEKGNPITINAERTLKRGMRRNLDRYQDRRDNLITIMREAGWIDEESKLAEDGKHSTFSTWELRSNAATEKIELEELARVLLAINKKRGYKSSRKAKNEEEGELIDGMGIAKQLYEENITPGQFVFRRLKEGKKVVPSFYRSDLQNEFDKIWEFQKEFYPEILTQTFYDELKGKGLRATSAAFYKTYGFNTADIKDLDDDLKNEKTIKLNKRDQKKLQAYRWRNDALTKQLAKEEVAYVLTEINNDLNKSSGYLGAISDRSKELFFNKQTVGQYLYAQLKNNPHTRLKNQVFYRQDYLDEFETIWEKQASFHPELTEKLKSEIRDLVIFYQRKLKSQKGLISFCEFENKEIWIEKNGKKVKKKIGLRVAPRSSPLFQEVKILQNLNYLLLRNKITKEQFYPDEESRELLFEELNLKGNLKNKRIFELLELKPAEWELNYTEGLQGNKTNQELYNAYLKILEIEGYDEELLKLSNKDDIEINDLKTSAREIKEMVRQVFEVLEIDTGILDFNPELPGKDFENQASYRLWHLLYSYEGDDSKTGNEKLYELLESKFGFKREHASILANVTLEDDYGNLSTKAMRKIIPFLLDGLPFAGRKDFPDQPGACEKAGYRHSKHSLTKEEIDSRELDSHLEEVKKNSLRNPVVEKILNQMANAVNALIDKENSNLIREGKQPDFKFDEIRIELARELKRNAKERKEMTQGINEAKRRNEKIVKILQSEFGLANPTRNDIIRYRLYQELRNNNFKDLYTDKYIPAEKLFSKEIDIEHIIPQSRVFDDSFSNKTVVYRKDNLEKGNKTAYDFIKEKFGEEGVEKYKLRLESLYELGKRNSDEGINRTKFRKLLKTEAEIGDGFIERDLRNSQYIAKKARELLFQITRSVVPTTGSVTARLREDWGLINVMKELNLPKYRELGLTEMEERKHGQKVEVIEDWSKRNDHRHHAMDALTVAFTKPGHIQYLNYLNARKDEKSKFHLVIKGIESKETELRETNNGGKERVFREPLPNFRKEAKKHLKEVLISHKAKNKVVTRNKNKIKTAKGSLVKTELTPRGQLHKETVYGKYHIVRTKEEKITAKFDEETINKVSNPRFRKALLQRLRENDNNPKKAFSGKNTISKSPLYLDKEKNRTVPESVKLVWQEEDFSIRKDVNPENFKTEKHLAKIIDGKVREIMTSRFKEYGNDSQKAFSDLELNPIWLNKGKGIQIKRVRISGVNNAVALHHKKDHFGNFIKDEDGNKIPVDYVSTGNNHHVAIYRDSKGNLQENVVSFYEAVERVNQGLPIINKTFNAHLGWEFLFTMKQNEMFVFPGEENGFNPDEIDLLDPTNKELISPYLYRVQKIATKNYMFRHHLETSVEEKKELRNISYINIRSTNPLKGVVKLRLNHLGDIVSVGEY